MKIAGLITLGVLSVMVLSYAAVTYYRSFSSTAVMCVRTERQIMVEEIKQRYLEAYATAIRVIRATEKRVAYHNEAEYWNKVNQNDESIFWIGRQAFWAPWPEYHKFDYEVQLSKQLFAASIDKYSNDVARIELEFKLRFRPILVSPDEAPSPFSTLEYWRSQDKDDVIKRAYRITVADG
jgi:hypothetical protein